MTRLPVALALSTVLWTGSTGISLAGTVCGTVRDGLTSAPVAGAGVFAWNSGGGYAGFAAVTDVAGSFCLSGLPAGTYDLQVRVDDYLEKILRGVVVEDGVSGVDVPLPPRVRLEAPWPNPSVDHVSLGFEIPARGTVALEIFDLSGRLVQGWRTPDLEAGHHTVRWNFEDGSGRKVREGIYVARLSAAGVNRVRKIVFPGR